LFWFEFGDNSSEVEHLPSIIKALGSILGTTRREEKRREEKRREEKRREDETE
jgi:Sec-independent protein translocase protein TatA